jgi:hypothetical protein
MQPEPRRQALRREFINKTTRFQGKRGARVRFDSFSRERARTFCLMTRDDTTRRPPMTPSQSVGGTYPILRTNRDLGKQVIPSALWHRFCATESALIGA